MNINDVILAPVLTEKSSAAMAAEKVTFRVHPDATKVLVKLAVEGVLGAKVAKVNMISKRGKQRRVGRLTGRTADWKKAVVTLKTGEKIALLEGLSS